MADVFQRLFIRPEPEALSLNAQAALGPVREPERSQFAHLMRHFIERFFNHETASPEGDAKARMVLVAFAAGLPGFVVALYLWPIYHQYIHFRQSTSFALNSPPPYWLQVNHHFFFVLYAFVSMGIVTVFEWDLFFPDLLDLFVLGSLPIAARRIFFARVAAISVFVAGFLFDANFLAPLVLPASTDPPNLTRFLAGHVLAVALSGIFAAAFILALEGILLALFGERIFRKFSLALQGLAIACLLLLLLLFPVFSGVVPVLLESGSPFAYCFPPLWFLGIEQRLIDGPGALPIYAELGRTGCVATLIAVAAAAMSYPIAYLRRVRDLIVGPGASAARSAISLPFDRMLHLALIRRPIERAIFHFISQTILRVPRYRIYLVMYGGVGLAVVVASVLRFTVAHGAVHAAISADGVRAAVGIVAFWTIAGLRMAFVSSGNQRGSWVFRIVHGRPPQYETAVVQLDAAKSWVLFAACAITLACCAAFHFIEPQELLQWPAVLAQWLVALGLCFLLTDVFFLHVTEIPFTGERRREQSNLAFSVLKYYVFFPFVSLISVVSQMWIAGSVRRFVVVALIVVQLHLWLDYRHRRVVREFSELPALEDDEEEFPMKLGLRY